MLFSTACSNKGVPQVQRQLTLEIVDKLVIKYSSSLGLVDMSSDIKHLLLYRMNGHVLVSQFDGEIISDIPCVGSGPDQVGDKINSLGFLNDTSIIVCGTTGYRIYNLNGVLVDSKSDNTIFISRTADRLYIDSIQSQPYIIHDYLEYPKYDGSPYSEHEKVDLREYRAITFFDYENDSSEVVIDIPEDLIEYFTKYRTLFRVVLGVDVLSDRIFVIFNPVPKMFIYDYSECDTLLCVPRLVNVLDLALDNPMDPILVEKDRFKEIFVNGRFKRVMASGNRLIVLYGASIAAEEFTGVNRGEWINQLSTIRKNFIQVLDAG